MISGVVNNSFEATIRLVVQGAPGKQLRVEPVIDTGFSEYLSLPRSSIASLGLRWIGKEETLLADGSIILAHIYEGSVIWDGQARTVEIEAAETMPLIGMAMLRDHELRIQVREAGAVTIETLP